MILAKSLLLTCGLTSVALPLSAQSPVDASARHCLSDYAKGRFAHLESDAAGNHSFEARLFASYLLYKKDPKTYRGTFIKAIPANRGQFEAFSLIATELVSAPDAETYEVTNPSVPWPISFWQIHQTIVDLAISGVPKAIKATFGLSGFGDGEVGEGLDESWRLFYHPKLVAAHWSLFEPHIEDLGAVRSESTEAEIQVLKAKYSSAFKHDLKALKAIHYQLEHGER